ncbi:MAG: TIM barrel protein [Betaproteobacteria bacterium]|nr:TIM barrel protein [Betaproteobacteria bacterium]
MPKFCANLTLLFNEASFLDRFELAAKEGFEGVEYLFPYAYPKAQLAEKLAAHELQQILHNMPAGDWEQGSRGIACLPDRVGEFQDGVGQTIEYATALRCKQVNCLAGIAPVGADPERCRRTFVDNLAFAAPKLQTAGIRLLFDFVDRIGYRGWIGCEYKPKTTTVAGLGWIRPHLPKR